MNASQRTCRAGLIVMVFLLLSAFRIHAQGITDPDPNALSSPDGQGGMHSYLLVGDGDFRYHLQIPHGIIEKYHVQSSFLGQGVDVNVYVPPVLSTDSLPLLILLHGGNMDMQQWIDNGQIANYMDNLLSRGAVKPFMIAMPSYGPFSKSEDLPGFLAWDLPGLLECDNTRFFTAGFRQFYGSLKNGGM